ncbi:MAG: thioredoxin [Chloroflexi bacterium]|nr:thioredoxin [Chloroflexota bacterium]
MSWPVHVSDATFATEVLGSSAPVMVEYWASWCEPCQEMAPIIEQVASEYSGRLKVAKLDADTNPDTIGLYGIESIPTFHIFQNGTIIASRVGAMSGETLRTWIDRSIG